MSQSIPDRVARTRPGLKNRFSVHLCVSVIKELFEKNKHGDTEDTDY
jgi:hypothetical protein